jgi:Flp pilus assembly protein TadD
LTRARVPLLWAAAQNNLGNTLQTLGSREGTPARFEQAVQAYREALEEFTRDRVPLDWAAVQNNLGNALEKLGMFSEAVEAYRNAGEVFTREAHPDNNAMVIQNLVRVTKQLLDRIKQMVLDGSGETP